MKLVGALVLSCLVLSSRFSGAGSTSQDPIRTILDQQVAAWNRGDLKEFVSTYAQHCTLVGNTISDTTREQVLAHYRQKYPSTGAMGKLEFFSLTIHHVEAHTATVTGRWRLDRAAKSGGTIGGVFSLVFELIDGSWQIFLDHTS